MEPKHKYKTLIRYEDRRTKKEERNFESKTKSAKEVKIHKATIELITVKDNPRTKTDNTKDTGERWETRKILRQNQVISAFWRIRRYNLPDLALGCCVRSVEDYASCWSYI